MKSVKSFENIEKSVLYAFYFDNNNFMKRKIWFQKVIIIIVSNNKIKYYEVYYEY